MSQGAPSTAEDAASALERLDPGGAAARAELILSYPSAPAVSSSLYIMGYLCSFMAALVLVFSPHWIVSRVSDGQCSVIRETDPAVRDFNAIFVRRSSSEQQAVPLYVPDAMCCLLAGLMLLDFSHILASTRIKAEIALRHLFITLCSQFTYVSLSMSQGAWVICSFHAPEPRPFLLTRMISWAATTPMLLYSIGSLAQRNSTWQLRALALDLGLIATGIVASLTEPFTLSWTLWIGLSMVMHTVLMLMLAYIYFESKTLIVDSPSESFVIGALAIYSVVAWSVFPAVWLADVFGIVRSKTANLLFFLADISAKGIFSYVLAHMNFAAADAARMSRDILVRQDFSGVSEKPTSSMVLGLLSFVGDIQSTVSGAFWTRVHALLSESASTGAMQVALTMDAIVALVSMASEGRSLAGGIDIVLRFAGSLPGDTHVTGLCTNLQCAIMTLLTQSVAVPRHANVPVVVLVTVTLDPAPPSLYSGSPEGILLTVRIEDNGISFDSETVHALAFAMSRGASIGGDALRPLKWSLKDALDAIRSMRGTLKILTKPDGGNIYEIQTLFERTRDPSLLLRHRNELVARFQPLANACVIIVHPAARLFQSAVESFCDMATCSVRACTDPHDYFTTLVRVLEYEGRDRRVVVLMDPRAGTMHLKIDPRVLVFTFVDVSSPAASVGRNSRTISRPLTAKSFFLSVTQYVLSHVAGDGDSSAAGDTTSGSGGSASSGGLQTISLLELKVLVLDGAALNLMFTKLLLHECGVVAIDTAISLTEALERAGPFAHYDVVLIDSDFESPITVRSLRARFGTTQSRTMFVLVAKYNEYAKFEAESAEHFDMLLCKPVDAVAVREVLMASMRRKLIL